MIGNRQRVLTVEETEGSGYAVNATGESYERHDEAHDAPPEQFSERIRDEGGDVYVVPVLEMLRLALRRRLAGSEEAQEADAVASGGSSGEDAPL